MSERSEAYRLHSEQATAKFKSENDVSEEEMKFIDDIAIVTAMVSKFQEVFKVMPQDLLQKFAKMIYGVRQMLNESFPMSKDGQSLTSTCIMCWTLEMPADECPHEQHVRMAMLAMAAFRVSPPIDLDVDADEAPDPNEGMVES